MSREYEEVDIFLRCCSFHGEFTVCNDLSTVNNYSGTMSMSHLGYSVNISYISCNIGSCGNGYILYLAFIFS